MSLSNGTLYMSVMVVRTSCDIAEVMKLESSALLAVGTDNELCDELRREVRELREAGRVKHMRGVSWNSSGGSIAINPGFFFTVLYPSPRDTESNDFSPSLSSN